MGTRKFRLLMSKYGFSIAIILIELFVVFAVILYMSQIAPLVWVILVFLISIATVIVMPKFMTRRIHNSLLTEKKCGNRCWRI